VVGLERYKTPEKLTLFLQELLSQKKLPTHKGKVARSVIERKYGFQHCSLSNYHGFDKYQWCKNVVDHFESDLIEKEGGDITGVNSEYGTPIRFKKLLDKLRDDIDSLPMTPQGDRSGRISFRAFERKFKFPTNSLVSKNAGSWQWARDMLNEFDEELYKQGITGTVWERKVPDIRKYLEKLDVNQELPINELGKLNRRAVMVHFGMPSNQSTSVAESRAPKLKELFKEYDGLISQQDYSQYAGDKYKEALSEILKNKELVLDSSSRVISIKWLAQELNTTKNTIRTSPNLMKLIEDRTQLLHQTQQQGVTKKSFNVYGAPHINLGATPYSVKHQRVYSFQSLISLYGLWFAEKIGTTFIAISNGCATGTAKNKYQTIKRFFEWITEPSNIDSEVFELLKSDSKVSQALFAKTCMRYRASMLQDKPNSKLQLNVITEFGSARVIPKYTFKQKGRAVSDKAHKPSLVEASIKKEDKDLLESVLIDSAKYRDIEISTGKDTQAFLDTLLIEKAANPELPEDFTEAIHEITRSRLLEIRIAASRTFLKWKNIHEQGNELIKSATVDTEEFAKKLEQRTNNVGGWRDYLSSMLPIHNKHQTLCNLLAIIRANYASTPPNTATTGYQMWDKKSRLVGGIEHVAAHLIPTRKALSAALTLYLCESGANVAVALTLLRDCVQPSNVEYHKKVVGRKDRSYGKAIYDDLATKTTDDECISAVNALDYIAKTLNSVNATVDSDNESLSMHFRSGRLQLLTEFAFRDEFKAICNTSEYLKKFNLVPSMLRPTVLLDIQLQDPANLGVAQLMAQHEQGATTEGYTNKLPHRIRMENHILDYQKTLEFVMTSGEDEPHTKLDVSEEEWEARRESAQRTGFGVFCSDRITIDASGKKSKCDEVEHCVQCKHSDSKKRMWVSADPESISDMIIWRTSLEKHEKAFTAKNIDRWEDVWVAWQAFYFVVLEQKMTRGKLSAIKKEAIDIANKKMSDDSFVLPEPW